MTATANRVKPQRKLTVARAFDGRDLIMCVVEGKTIDHYFVAPRSSDWGRAFEVEKMGEHNPYAVLLGEDGHDGCECKGWLKWNKCRHVAACRKLIELQQV